VTGSNAVLAQAVRLLERAKLSDAASADARSALGQLPASALGFAVLAGEDAKLDFATTCERAAALALSQAAINLADDLCDGDCYYLEEPVRRAPGTQILLQSLALVELIQLGIDAEVLSSWASDLVAAASDQQVEIRTTQWTLTAFEYCA